MKLLFPPLLSLSGALLAAAPLCACDPPARAVEAQDPVQKPAQDAPAPAADLLQKKVDEITPRVAELRGMPFKHPVPAGIQTADEFIEFAKKDLEGDMSVDQFNAMGQAMELLGLVEDGSHLFDTYMDLLKGQVGGYYDPKTRKFYMISAYNSGLVADIIMAHELTHALDDQYYDLDKIMKSAGENSDRQFAVRAVVEGSGTSVMNLYTVKGMAQKWFELTAEDSEQMQKMMEDQMGQIEAAPPYLLVTLALPYLEGNKFLVRDNVMLTAMTKSPQAADLNHAFAEPPLSSEQVLHFQKYWEADQRDDPTAVDLPDLSEALGKGWSLAYSDTLGELGAYFLVTDELPDVMGIFAGGATLVDPASEGWDGDTYQFYRGPDGAQAMLWGSVWDTPEDAGEFAEALVANGQPRTPGLRKVRETKAGVLVTFANAAGQDAVQRLEQALAKSHPDWN